MAVSVQWVSAYLEEEGPVRGVDGGSSLLGLDLVLNVSHFVVFSGKLLFN